MVSGYSAAAAGRRPQSAAALRGTDGPLDRHSGHPPLPRCMVPDRALRPKLIQTPLWPKARPGSVGCRGWAASGCRARMPRNMVRENVSAISEYGGPVRRRAGHRQSQMVPARPYGKGRRAARKRARGRPGMRREAGTGGAPPSAPVRCFADWKPRHGACVFRSAVLACVSAPSHEFWEPPFRL